MPNLLGTLLALVLLLDWVVVRAKWYRLRVVTKPLVMLLLIACFLGAGGWKEAPRFFAVGFGFSLAGDIFLLENLSQGHPVFFLLGLTSFLTAHVMYILGFSPTLPPLGWGTLYALLASQTVTYLAALTILRGVRRHKEASALRWPITVYILTVGVMMFSAFATLARPDWDIWASFLVSVGAVLFFTSDGILGYNLFVAPLRNADILLTVTYHLAQISIAAGVLLQYGVLLW